MHIVHIPRRFVRDRWGGTETVVLRLSKLLVEKGHTSEVLCPSALSSRGMDEIDGIPIRRTAYFYPYFGLRAGARQQLDLKGGNLCSFALMRRLATHREVDLVHLHTRKRLGGMVRAAARWRGVPYVVHLHGGLEDTPVHELESYIAPTRGSFEWGRAIGACLGSRRVESDASAILCVGEEEQRRIQVRFPTKRVEHLPGGVDIKRFAQADRAGFRHRHGIHSDAQVLLVVGRLDPQKNQLAALAALAALRSRRPLLHLVLLGHVTDPAYAEEIRRQIVAQQLGGQVTLIPGVEPSSPVLPEAYHAADVLLVPSIHEPFGLVALEAWASGLPVVANTIGGLAHLITDGTTGLLFPENDLEAMVDRIERVLDCEQLRGRLRSAARIEVEAKYSWQVIGARTLRLYRSIIADHHRLGRAA
jgi:glycosyltransferase involved in cell wall biosynthesis